MGQSPLRTLSENSHNVSEGDHVASCKHCAYKPRLKSEDDRVDVCEVCWRSNVGPHHNCRLHSAVSAGDKRLVRQILHKYGAETCLLALDREKQNVLHASVRLGNVALVRLFITEGADVNAPTACSAKWTPLHLAAIHQHVDVARLLLDNGAQVDARDDIGETALRVCMWGASSEFPELLLRRGADPNDRANNSEDSPFTLVLNLTPFRERVAELMIEYGADCTYKKAVFPAAKFGHLKIFKLMLSRGADVNAIDDNQERRTKSLLISAIFHRQTYAVRWLLEYGADVNLEVAGRLPLDVAIEDRMSDEESRSIVSHLLRRIALLAAQGLPVHEGNLQAIQRHEATIELYERHLRELELMRSTRVRGDDGEFASVAYFDLLTMRGKALVQCLRCEWLRAALTGPQAKIHRAQFPVYGSDVAENCDRGLKRIRMAEEYQELLHREVFGSRLPYDVTLKIIEYFGDDELKGSLEMFRGPDERKSYGVLSFISFDWIGLPSISRVKEVVGLGWPK